MKKIFLLILMFSLLFAVPSLTEAKISLGVADFVDRAHARSFGQMSGNTQITDVFIKVLSATSNTIEVTRSKSLQTLEGMTAESAVSAGKSAGCQYVLLGVLTKNDVAHSYTYGGFWGATPKTSTETQTINLDTRLIEVATGKVIFSAVGSGAASISLNMKEEMEKVYDQKHQKEMVDRHNNLMDDAVASASSMVAEKLCAFLAGEYTEVSSIKANKDSKTKKSGKKNVKPNLGSVKVNRGTASGVHKETLYRIYFEGEEVFDIGGASLGHEKFNVGLAEVKEARTNFSTAEVFAGNFKNIRDGDKAEQISREEAELIIDRNDFARDRFSEFLRKR